MKIRKLDKRHPNYRRPLNARWFCVVDDVEYFNRTRDGLREHIKRAIWNQEHDPRKEPWPGTC